MIKWIRVMRYFPLSWVSWTVELPVHTCCFRGPALTVRVKGRDCMHPRSWHRREAASPAQLKEFSSAAPLWRLFFSRGNSYLDMFCMGISKFGEGFIKGWYFWFSVSEASWSRFFFFFNLLVHAVVHWIIEFLGAKIMPSVFILTQ